MTNTMEIFRNAKDVGRYVRELSIGGTLIISGVFFCYWAAVIV